MTSRLTDEGQKDEAEQRGKKLGWLNLLSSLTYRLRSRKMAAYGCTATGEATSCPIYPMHPRVAVQAWWLR